MGTIRERLCIDQGRTRDPTGQREDKQSFGHRNNSNKLKLTKFISIHENIMILKINWSPPEDNKETVYYFINR